MPDEVIMSKILLIRGKKVILDSDLSELYGVPTKRLNEQVKRKKRRFPEHFMFQLTKEEKEEVVANCDHLQKLKYSPYLPHAFTDHGIVMLANVLNSERAIQGSIRITEVFIKMHEMLLTHKELFTKLNELEKKFTDHDDKIMLIFEYLKQLEKAKQEELEFKKRKKIGF
ncbi:MAG: hypothetical protein COC01_07565 [Bacteroidetes bacterium]|nr:MAG: hypothetical protein COC01_07565 [Bacteroidota bacterium]